MRRKLVPVFFSASLLVLIAFSTAVGRADAISKLVKVRDECTASFNVFFNDPTICQQSNGKVDIFAFLDYLMKHHDHPLWKFNPASFTLPAGKSISLQNEGGEFHTWTEVAEFGGGFIPELNFGAEPRMECFDPEGVNNVFLGYQAVESGATAGSADLPSGTHKFMCCIHPWMRTVVKVN